MTLTELVYLGEANFGGSAPELSMEGVAFRLKKNLKILILSLPSKKDFKEFKDFDFKRF